MTTTVIELVTYKLIPNADLAVLDKINEEINVFLKAQPGFLYRSFSEDDTNTLYDIIYWQEMAHAKQAATAFEQSAMCASLMSIADPESVKVQHMPAKTEVMMCESETA